MSQALVNLNHKMKTRELRKPYAGWRPRPVSVKMSRYLGGCAVQHSKHWRHDFGMTLINNAYQMAIIHRLPGEIPLRKAYYRVAAEVRWVYWGLIGKRAVWYTLKKQPAPKMPLTADEVWKRRHPING